jgi:hypothetical protein
VIDGLMRRILPPRILWPTLVACALACGVLLSAGNVSAAEGGEAPVIVSASVTGLTEHDATVEAQINSEGLETTYELWLEYKVCKESEGVSCDLWSSEVVGHGTIAAGDAGVTVSAGLTDLKPDKAYIYRVVAANSAGTTKGQPHQFETPPPESVSPQQEPPSPPPGAGSEPGATGATGSPGVSLSSDGGPVDLSSAPPSPTTTSKVTGKALKLAEALKMCGKRPRRLRSNCERQARRRYATAARKTRAGAPRSQFPKAASGRVSGHGRR